MKSIKFFDPKIMFQRYSNEFNENDVSYVQDWLKSQPHLPALTDSEVCLFLHASYFHKEKCKARIDGFYTFRSKLPSIYNDRNIRTDDMALSAEVLTIAIIPKRTPMNDVLQVIKINDTDPSKFNFASFMKRFNMYSEIDLLMDGVHFLLDFKGVKLAHFTKLNPLLLKQMMFYLQHCYPVRVKASHIMKTTPLLDKLIALVKPFLEIDLYVHDTIEEFYKFIPSTFVPNDFEGGEEKPAKIIQENYLQFLAEHQDYFDEEQLLRRTKEDLRQTKSRLVNEFFGVEGSFKKLEID